MKFEIFLPTYKRIGQLSIAAKSIKNFIPSSALENIKCYVFFSEDDKESYDGAKKDNMFGFMNHELFIMNKKSTLVEKINHYFMNVFAADACVGLTDDTILIDDYLFKALSYYESSFMDTDAVLCFRSVEDYGNGKRRTNLYSYCVCGRAFVDRFPNRQFACPYYTSHGIDVELSLFAKSINKWYMFTEPGYIIHNRIDESGGIYADSCRDNIKNISKSIFNRRYKRGLLWGKNFENFKD